MVVPFIRPVVHKPRVTLFLAAHPGKIDSARLQVLIDELWADLLRQLADPIKIRQTRKERVVEVLGAARYCIDKESGHIRVLEPTRRENNTVVFAMSPGQFAADLPFIPTGVWMVHYLDRWRDRLDEVLIDHDLQPESWHTTVWRILWNCVLRSTNWKRLRYAVRNALALDTKVLSWCRQGRSRQAVLNVTVEQYNRTLAQRATYEQIKHDNPNLVWLYTFLLAEEISLPPGEAISSMKQVLCSHGVTPAGWRLLAKGCERDFIHVRDWVGPPNEQHSRAIALVNWLRLAPKLRLHQPVRGALQRLFLHDSFGKFGPGGISFRNVPISLATLNVLLAEAGQRSGTVSYQTFVEREVVDVMTWLQVEKPILDKNQLKAGWPCLARRAQFWKAERQAEERLSELRWESCVHRITIGQWTILPITDAWQLREEALRQHHCADSYIRECLSGTIRVFSVQRRDGRRVATIGIERKDNGWKSFGIRGLANAPVKRALFGLDQEVVARYEYVWRLEQSVSPSPDGEKFDTEAAATRHLEDTRGPYVDANDPMLPAAIEMEHALMKMMGHPRSA